IQPPENIEFASSRYNGSPSRPSKAILLVNLKSFTGRPEIKFWLESVTGKIALGDDESESAVRIKVRDEHRVASADVARVPISFKGTGWGQHAELWASAKLPNGGLARTKCKIRLQRPPGDNKF